MTTLKPAVTRADLPQPSVDLPALQQCAAALSAYEPEVRAWERQPESQPTRVEAPSWARLFLGLAALAAGGGALGVLNPGHYRVVAAWLGHPVEYAAATVALLMAAVATSRMNLVIRGILLALVGVPVLMAAPSVLAQRPASHPVQIVATAGDVEAYAEMAPASPVWSVTVGQAHPGFSRSVRDREWVVGCLRGDSSTSGLDYLTWLSPDVLLIRHTDGRSASVTIAPDGHPLSIDDSAGVLSQPDLLGCH